MIYTLFTFLPIFYVSLCAFLLSCMSQFSTYRSCWTFYVCDTIQRCLSCSEKLTDSQSGMALTLNVACIRLIMPFTYLLKLLNSIRYGVCADGLVCRSCTAAMWTRCRTCGQCATTSTWLYAPSSCPRNILPPFLCLSSFDCAKLSLVSPCQVLSFSATSSISSTCAISITSPTLTCDVTLPSNATLLSDVILRYRLVLRRVNYPVFPV